jgi:toxin ParE1/3/4
MTPPPVVFEVLLTRGAEQDLEAIHEYIAAHDSPSAANQVLDHLLTLADSLARHPERGAHPKELLALGIREYRQALYKPYRVVYRVVDARVIITLIVDGRRDLQALLARRLLGA